MAVEPGVPLTSRTFKDDSWTHGSSLSMRDDAPTPFGSRRGGTIHAMDDSDDILIDPNPSLLGRVVDSFRRDPFAAPSRVRTTVEPLPSDGSAPASSRAFYYDLRRANLETSSPALARKLKGRHLQMIAIGGSIGSIPPQCKGAPALLWISRSTGTPQPCLCKLSVASLIWTFVSPIMMI